MDRIRSAARHAQRTGRGAGRGQARRGAARRPNPAVGEDPRRGIRGHRSVAELARALPVPEPAGLARSGNPRLRRPELRARTTGARRRHRSDAADQGRLRLRGRRNHGINDTADVVRAAPRRLPGLRPYHDFRYARPRAARRLCQRLSQNGQCQGGSSRGGRCDACLGAGGMRRGGRLVRTRSDQRNFRRRRPCGARHRPRLRRRRSDRRRHLRLR